MITPPVATKGFSAGHRIQVQDLERRTDGVAKDCIVSFSDPEMRHGPRAATSASTATWLHRRWRPEAI